MADERTWFITLDPAVRIRVAHEVPLQGFSVALEIATPERRAGWLTVRLIDNAHDTGVAHMHRYIGVEKKPAERFAEGRPDKTMPQAIDYLKTAWPAILEGWSR